jgi:hypothetical protein
LANDPDQELKNHVLFVDVEGSSHCLIKGNILAFAWRDCGKSQKKNSHDS